MRFDCGAAEALQPRQCDHAQCGGATCRSSPAKGAEIGWKRLPFRFPCGSRLCYSERSCTCALTAELQRLYSQGNVTTRNAAAQLAAAPQQKALRSGGKGCHFASPLVRAFATLSAPAHAL